MVIKMDVMTLAIKMTLFSGYIKNEKPVNLLLIAKPESGKTELLQGFQQNEGIEYFTDVTAHGLQQSIIPKIQAGKKVTHIIIPDLLNPLSKQKATVDSLIMFLNALTEEGIENIETYAAKIKSLKGMKVQCGIIGCITKDGFEKFKKKWKSIGFLSRMLPVSYSFSVNNVEEIFNNVIQEEFKQNQPMVCIFPKEEVEIQSSVELNQRLKFIASFLGNISDAYGFRAQKQLQTLLKASALMNDRTETNEEDVQNVIKVANYMNFNYNPI